MPKLEQTPDPINVLVGFLQATAVRSSLSMDEIVRTAAMEEEPAIGLDEPGELPVAQGRGPETARVHVFPHITLEEQDKALIIRLNDTPESREEIESLYNKPTTHALSELLKDATNNGWDWIYPDEVDSLTEAPILGTGIIRDTSGTLVGVDRVYWYSSYLAEDPLRELRDTGKVSFLRSPTREILCDDVRVNAILVAAGVFRDESFALVAPADLDLQGLDNVEVPIARVAGLLNVRGTTGLRFPDLIYVEAIDGSYSKDLDVGDLETVEYWAAFKGVGDDLRAGGMRSVGTHLLVEDTQGTHFDALETVGVLVDGLGSKGLHLPNLKHAGVGVFTWSDTSGGQEPYMPYMKNSPNNHRPDE